MADGDPRQSDREQAEMLVTYLLGPEASTLEGTPEAVIRGRMKHLAAERKRTGKKALQIIAEELAEGAASSTNRNTEG